MAGPDKIGNLARKGIEPTPQLPYVAVLRVDPGMGNPSEARLNFDTHLRMNPKAIVLEVYATGGPPEAMVPFIKDSVQKGVPVFLLSTNYARDTGIQQLSYGPQQLAAEAGAIPLRDVNVDRTLDVVAAVQAAANKGLVSKDLEDEIINQFGTVAPRPE